MTRERKTETESSSEAELSPWREHLHEVIFEADTFAGKTFDVALLIAILLSVLVVILDSVKSIHATYHDALVLAEWTFTALFTLEYILRLLCTRRPLRYARSFFGVIDLLAVIPTYLGAILVLVPSISLTGGEALLVIRALRLLRVFRVFKLAHFLSEAKVLREALLASRPKIVVFLVTVMVVVTIMGALMHLVEGPESGFTSIPQSMYWAVVTMTTVGYGDIAPESNLGKFFAALMMILGYSLIIVPTGILSAELAHAGETRSVSTQACPVCSGEGHDADATHCKYCGGAL